MAADKDLDVKEIALKVEAQYAKHWSKVLNDIMLY